MRPALLALLLAGACLPNGTGSLTPPTRFTVLETAPTLEPQETLFTAGHAQPISVDPTAGEEGQLIRTDAFIELNARLRRGFSPGLEGQLTLTGILDQAAGVGRAGLKYQLIDEGDFRLSLLGGTGLGWNFNGNEEGPNGNSGFGGIDVGLIASTPRHWKLSPYGYLGTNLSGTAFAFGNDAEGNPLERSELLFAPHAVIGGDLWALSSHLLFEATTYLIVNDGGATANFLFSFGVSFGVGKKRYVPPRTDLPDGLYICEDGQYLVDGACLNRCPKNLDRCDSPTVCVIANGSPTCRIPQAVGRSQPDSEPASAPSAAPDSVPSSAPASAPDAAPSSLPSAVPSSAPSPAP